MKRIAIIGASELQNPLIEKAKEMGLETHVFAWKCGDIGEKTADFFYPISIVEKEEILEKCKEIGVDAVATIASDLGNVIASFVARNLGLPANSEHCVEVSSNKYKMRKTFQENRVSVPIFFEVSEGDTLDILEDINYPIIVKPTDRSGSRGITKLETPDGLKEAVKRAIDVSLEKKAIVEEFIEGKEYSAECITYDEKHTMLAITKKYTTGAPNYIETGHMEPSDLSELEQEKVKKEVFKALDALDIKMGASHSEFKIDLEGNIKIIEIGSRMGGDFIGSDLVRLSTGYDFVKMVIQTALGEKPTIDVEREPTNAAVRYIFSAQENEKIYRTIKEEKIKIEKQIINIENEHKVMDSSSRYGCYLVSDNSICKIRKILD